MVSAKSGYDLMSGMNNLANLTEGSEQKNTQQDEESDDAEQPVEQWKQPRAIHDGWPDESKRARELTTKLCTNLQQRAEAIRMKQSTGK